MDRYRYLSNSNQRQVTLELIRKRSEHNECLVSNLEEIALHQEELETIGPTLGRTCGKTLKILLLQNNVIDRLHPSDTRHFQCLEYLNVALNNISTIEGLDHMEHLNKLDLTLNFIDLDCWEESVACLVPLRSLRELFLMGNPVCRPLPNASKKEPKIVELIDEDEAVNNDHCDKGSGDINLDWNEEYYRWYVVAKVPQLEYLDGKQITPSERIRAMQQLPQLERALPELAWQRAKLKKEKLIRSKQQEQDTTTHCPEDRLRISNEMAQQKAEKEQNEKANLVTFKGDDEFQQEQQEAIQRAREREEMGDIKQCNEGRWQFHLEEHKRPGYLTLDIPLPKHLSSDLMDVDVHPTYIRIVIKSKVLRLKLPCEVRSEASTAERSTTTGHLLVSMPKCDPTIFTLKGKEDGSVDSKRIHNRTASNQSAISNPNGRKGMKHHPNPRLYQEMLQEAYNNTNNTTRRSQPLKGPVRLSGIVKESNFNGSSNKKTNVGNESQTTIGLDMVENRTSKPPFKSQHKYRVSRGDIESHEIDDDDAPPSLL